MTSSECFLSDAAHRDLEAEALLALGRLDGSLATVGPTTLRLFALRLLRDLLIAALRQEGHMFTDQRFHAWFAGVATLSDQPPRSGRPPRVLCEAILTELSHNSWAPLAELAIRFRVVLLAPGDHTGSDLAAETAHQDALAVLAAARALLAALPPSPDPRMALAHLHRAAGKHVLFAPPERTPEPITMGSIRLTVERTAAPSPRWALELLWGEYWRAAGVVTHALPFAGLVRLEALRAGTSAAPEVADDTQTILASALRDVARGLGRNLHEADQLSRHLDHDGPGKRRSSRAPALFELLAGFGALRSAQLETLLGVSRMGLRAIIGTLDKTGRLERTTLAGVHLYTINLEARAAGDALESDANASFSSAALAEFDAAMADIDALLARSSINSAEAGQDGSP